MKELIFEFKKCFKDDYKKIGKYYIRPFSILWWLMFIGQGIAIVGGLWAFYVIAWILIG